MTKEETLKRIEDEAQIKTILIPDILKDFNNPYKQGFINGAKAERNKTLDEAIALVTPIANSEIRNYKEIGKVLIEELQKMKV